MATEQIELESAKLLSQYSGDRQNFLCHRHFTFRGKRHFQCLGLPKGLVFIDLPTSLPQAPADALNIGMAAAAGRLLGGHLGSQLAQIAVMGASSGTQRQVQQTFEMAGDGEIREIARQRPLSFAVKYEDVGWATIDPPRALATTAGLIRFKAKKIGTVEIEPTDLQEMLAAIKLFQSKLGDRVQMRVEFDAKKRRFVKSH